VRDFYKKKKEKKEAKKMKKEEEMQCLLNALLAKTARKAM